MRPSASPTTGPRRHDVWSRCSRRCSEKPGRAAIPRRSAFFTRLTSIRPATRMTGAADAVVPRRHAADACALLALQWLRCADGATSWPTRPASSTDLALVPGVSDALLTRALTGSFQDVAETLRARGVTLDHAASPGSRFGRLPGGPARAIVPRVLTDDTTSRALVAYATPAGAVCLTPQARESVIAWGPTGFSAAITRGRGRSSASCPSARTVRSHGATEWARGPMSRRLTSCIAATQPTP